MDLISWFGRLNCFQPMPIRNVTSCDPSVLVQKKRIRISNGMSQTSVKGKPLLMYHDCLVQIRILTLNLY